MGDCQRRSNPSPRSREVLQKPAEPAGADAFAILPGGLGTLDETFEIVSWKQLELHDKPILLVDIGGYWAPLRALLDHIVAKGFARPETRGLLRIVPTVAALMTALAAEPAPKLAIDPERF